MSHSLYISASCVISDQVVYRDGCSVFENKGAEVNSFLLSVYQHFGIGYPRFHKMDNLCKLGLLASEVLLAGLCQDHYRPDEKGIVLANASSSLDADLKYFETVSAIASPSLFVYTLPNIVIGEICIKQNMKGESAFFISEEFDALFLHQYVSGLMQEQRLKSCICGWVELMGQEYKAVLFLVEGVQNNLALPEEESFTWENIQQLYYLQNGKINV